LQRENGQNALSLSVQAQTAIVEQTLQKIKTNQKIHRWNKVEQCEKGHRSMEV